jgi:hypothetical protein
MLFLFWKTNKIFTWFFARFSFCLLYISSVNNFFKFYVHMIRKYCCLAMLLDKNWNHTRKEKWWNLSIFNLYFLVKCCKRDRGDLQKPLKCGFKDGSQVIIPVYLEFNGETRFLLIVAPKVSSTTNQAKACLSYIRYVYI